MTSIRPPAPTGHRFAFARAGVFGLLLLAAALAVVVPLACTADDDTVNDFIGVTDAEPPRLGRADDPDAAP